MKTRQFTIACVVALLSAGLVPPIEAEDGDKVFRFGLVYSAPTDDLVLGTQTTELDPAGGVMASFEYEFTDLIGLEGGLGFVPYDVTVKQPMFPDVSGETELFSVTANLNFHFEKDGGLDLIVGPTVGYAFWDDITLTGFAIPASTDDEFLFGAHFGVDRPIGDGPWSFNADLSYLVLDVAPPGGDIGVSPVQLKIGFGYSF